MVISNTNENNQIKGNNKMIKDNEVKLPFIKSRTKIRMMPLDQIDYEEWKEENPNKNWSFEKWNKWNIIK